ncbi:hypothetical protein COY26_02335 [Candidatus Woesearchaeota archaeon CG_4_10_14_0_2_um_filter_33_10]|nr:MAG: hypothetical protein COV14_01405 [Candidatus Woesearchaeota archaeon CG10_big_fil_rev_8_21_14_0_10_33_12]PIU72598.1 MAG: hypothetical protein COS79_01985 [Candidatus Woesearchaeota archaeon CG06_land_8_20_14_3_00_33_13]PIZ53290.1 MAG: hypothetical protein COY26_02335 [Candidatus Woesearchaeota archaeon CG_4_10_14_0_2_um_filter_33_10]
MEKEDIEHILKQHKKLLDKPRSCISEAEQGVLNKYNSLLNQIPKDIKDAMEGVIKEDNYVEWYYSPNEFLGKPPYESPKKEVMDTIHCIEWGIPS